MKNDYKGSKGCFSPSMVAFIIICLVFWANLFLTAQTPVDTTDVLPVKLLYFEAETTEANSVNLQWATGEEVNSNRFEVEVSTTDFNFESEITVISNGYASTYAVTYLKPYPGNNYFRLVHYDTDGSKQIFPVVSVMYEGKFEVYDAVGHYIGVFTDLEHLPKGVLYIVNGHKMVQF